MTPWEDSLCVPLACFHDDAFYPREHKFQKRRFASQRPWLSEKWASYSSLTSLVRWGIFLESVFWQVWRGRGSVNRHVQDSEDRRRVFWLNRSRWLWKPKQFVGCTVEIVRHGAEQETSAKMFWTYLSSHVGASNMCDGTDVLSSHALSIVWIFCCVVQSCDRSCWWFRPQNNHCSVEVEDRQRSQFLA